MSLLISSAERRVDYYFSSEILGYPGKKSAYFIRCVDCHAHWADDPQAWEAWEEEMRDNEQKLANLEKARVKVQML